MLSTHPTVGLMTFGAEHALRERTAQRATAVEAAVRADRDRTGWISLRGRIGGALIGFGRRLQGAAPAATGDRRRVNG